MMNPYTTLGIDRTASEDEIKKAYRKIAIKCHPDKNPSKEAEDKFRKATEAYDILKDPVKRKNYDTYGSTEGSFFGFGGGFSKSSRDYSNFNFEDLFTSTFGNSNDPFGFNINDILKNQQRSQYQYRKKEGSTLQARISLTLEEVATGCRKNIKYKKKITCIECGGTGAKKGYSKFCSSCGGSGQLFGTTCIHCGGRGKIIDSPCDTCYGEGLFTITEEINFDVPPGVSEDNNLTLKGMGNESPDGGTPGDFVVYVSVQKHEKFTRIKDDVSITLSLDHIDAVLGTMKIVETIHKTKIKLKIPPGTQPNYKMRVPGQGLPNRYSKINGDMLILVDIKIPKSIGEEEKKLYQKLKELRDNI